MMKKKLIINKTQLSMEKRLFETEIMRLALIELLEKVFTHVEHIQKQLECRYALSPMEKWQKAGQRFADSKFYLLSAMFVVMKSTSKFGNYPLDNHLDRHRPKELLNYTYTPDDQIISAIRQVIDETRKYALAYNKYTNNKFMEYTKYFTDSLKSVIKSMKKKYNVVQDNR